MMGEMAQLLSGQVHVEGAQQHRVLRRESIEAEVHAQTCPELAGHTGADTAARVGQGRTDHKRSQATACWSAF